MGKLQALQQFRPVMSYVWNLEMFNFMSRGLTEFTQNSNYFHLSEHSLKRQSTPSKTVIYSLFFRF